MGEALPQLGPEALPEVQAALDHFRIHLGAVEFELLVRSWAEHDPEAATLWTFEHAPSIYRAFASRTAVEIWAEEDPAAALVAAESSPIMVDEKVWRTVQIALVRGWFRKDRPSLERYIQDLGIGIRRQRALFAYALALASEQGSDALIEWAESIPEDDVPYKRSVYRQTLSALTSSDTDAAVRFCDAHCDGPYGGRLRVVLIRNRLRDGDDGAEVVEWVAGLPAEGEDEIASKRHELEVAFGFWSYLDRPSALRWMKERLAEDDPPEWLAHLYGEYARKLAPDSPAEAIRWAERIEDPSQRELTLVRIARRWLKVDEQAAEAWLEQSSLSERGLRQARDTSAPDYLPDADSGDPRSEDEDSG